MEYLWTILYTTFAPRIILFVGVSVLNSLLFVGLWVWIRCHALAAKPAWPVAIIVIGLVFRATLLFVEPTASDDLYRYLWDGKVQASGINPYKYAPADSALSSLHTETLPSRVNFPQMKTIYPPVAQGIFLLSHALGGESILTLKLLLLLCEALTLVLLLVSLRAMQLPEIHLALYAFCPLPILHFMVDAHVDGFAIPFLILGVLLWYRGAHNRAGLALAGAIATKIFPVITLPSLVSTLRGPRRIPALILPLALVGVLYLPFMLGGGDPFGSIITFSAHWEANSSFFRILLAVVNNNQWAHLISYAMIALWILFVASRRWPLVRQLYWSVVGFFLLASTVHPWYLAWVAILLPLLPRWSGIAYVALGNLAGITVIHYLQDGVWVQPLWALLVEYIPVYVLVAVELTKDFRETGNADRGDRTKEPTPVHG